MTHAPIPAPAHLITATRAPGQAAAIVCSCGMEATAPSLTASARVCGTHITDAMAALIAEDPDAPHLVMLATGPRSAHVALCRCGWASRPYRHPEHGRARAESAAGRHLARVDGLDVSGR